MSNAVSIIVIILVVIGLFFLLKQENYCGCPSFTTPSNRPVYSVYRPTGASSSYGDPCNSQINVAPTTEIPKTLIPFSDSNWRKTPETDFGNSWAAGSGCRALPSSVPLVTMTSPPQTCSSVYQQYPGTILTSYTTPVPYVQNYGTSSCNLQTVATNPLLSEPLPLCAVKVDSPNVNISSGGCCTQNPIKSMGV